MDEGFIYIGQPYTGTFMQQSSRYIMGRSYLLTVSECGLPAYAPIVQNHSLNNRLPGTWEFWSKLDLPILRKATELHVLQLEGWRESVGLTDEINDARSCKTPIRYIAVAKWGIEESRYQFIEVGNEGFPYQHITDLLPFLRRTD